MKVKIYRTSKKPVDLTDDMKREYHIAFREILRCGSYHTQDGLNNKYKKYITKYKEFKSLEELTNFFNNYNEKIIIKPSKKLKYDFELEIYDDYRE